MNKIKNKKIQFKIIKQIMYQIRNLKLFNNKMKFKKLFNVKSSTVMQ